MPDRKSTLTFLAKDQASGVVKKLDKNMDGLNKRGGLLSGTFGKVGGAAGAMAKVGLGAAVAAIAGLGVALAAGVKGALDEQVGIERLNTALKNNVKDWDGNRDAIEKVIDARTRLAFDDSALRDSLSSLVMRTKDVSAAMDLQALAMDLARAKGIDLKTASDIVGKVFSGNTGILSRYGIAVDKGATATEALAAIQAQAGGQAEAYGNTTKGAFDKFNIAIGNVFEDIGGALLPVLTGLATFLSDTLIPTVKDVVARVGDWFKENEPLITQIRDVLGVVIKTVTDLIGTLITKAGEFITWITSNATIMDSLRVAFKVIGDVIGLIVTAIGGLLTEAGKFVTWITTNKTLMANLQTIAAGIGTAFGIVADKVGLAIEGLSKLGDWIRTNIGGLRELLQMLPFLGPVIGLQNQIDRQSSGRSFAHGSRRTTEGPAYLHDDEMILPKGIADEVRSGRGGIGGGSVVLNIYGVTDPDEVARRVMQALQRERLRQNMSLG